MIRIVRLQDVVDLEGGGGVRSVMVAANDSGLTAEIAITPEQMALIVRLVQADEQAAPVAPRGVSDASALPAAPPQEVDTFANFDDDEDDGRAVVAPLDVQSLLDGLQPEGGDDIPGERSGAGQL